jgi:uroporphyrinogen decarboxylase
MKGAGVLTSRERVYAAVNHREADRVPICFGGCSATVIDEVPPHGTACSDLYKQVGILDVVPQVGLVGNIVAAPDERLIERLHSDMHYLYANVPTEVVEEDAQTKVWPFYFGMRIKTIGQHSMIDFSHPPMAHMETEADIAEYPYWPDLNTNIMDGVVEQARRLHEETEYFVVGDTPFAYYPFNGYGFNSGMDKWLLDMKLRPDFYHKLATRFLEANLAFTGQFYRGVGPYVDAAMVYDDLGTQTSGLMSLADYRAFYKPYQAEIIRNIRRHLRPEAKIMIHSCGSIFQFIPDLIEIGIDILNPVQPMARQMEPWRIKKEFGKDIAILGGHDTQYLLSNGTPEENASGVKKLLREYAPGGGYLFAASINIQADTPAENVLASFDAALEYGGYPLSIPKEQGEEESDYVTFILQRKLPSRRKRMSIYGETAGV